MDKKESPKWSPPASTSNRPLAFLGAGGRAKKIACLWASAGYDVNIQDLDEDRCDAALWYINTNASNFAERLGRDSRRVGKCRNFADLASAVNNVWLVVEACQGQSQSRIDILGEVDSMLPTDCILASTSSSTSNLIFARTTTRRRHLTCYIRYSLLPNNRAVELLPCPETDPGVLSFLTEHHQKMGLITAVSHGSSKRMRMFLTLRKLILFGAKCSRIQVVAIEDEYVAERNLESSFTSDFLRLKYIQEGRFGAGSPKGRLRFLKVSKSIANGDIYVPKTPSQPTLFFLDVGVGENVHSMEEAMTAGKILTTTPDGRQINTIVTRQSYPDGIDISLQVGRIFWTDMGVTGCKDGSIMSATLDGSDIQYIIPKGHVHTPKQLAMDHINSHLYFSDREGLCVSRCNFHGSNKTTLIQTGDPANPDHASDPLRFARARFTGRKKGAAKQAKAASSVPT
ncbi:hypothetical protein EPUS_05985 [Endocarpon pusillum Z07020]|uniref:3-hydroxyacyl-CoA dehydrogenase NAD binding domain-containing protein n=1 Tax=Endocarpon pusillum (strain Z07020 / HMAS-L-300199) TaxID=1263415 RepID=U1GHA7_ENDPU|nr:uncharacterized protein EPUS_05985 [Endocarpon pusillum Z07020]ERF71156.1 hypothetical protein EPUS_05985 [Endocarpon pusillum Z07020]